MTSGVGGVLLLTTMGLRINVLFLGVAFPVKMPILFPFWGFSSPLLVSVCIRNVCSSSCSFTATIMRNVWNTVGEAQTQELRLHE